MKNGTAHKKFIARILIAGAMLSILAFIATGLYIGKQVDDECKLAQDRYGGECTGALMNKIADRSDMRGKNGAIWALGQLGDKEALPFLRIYETEDPLPDKENWEEGISQYEVRKAIRLIEEGHNIAAFVWR